MDVLQTPRGKFAVRLAAWHSLLSDHAVELIEQAKAAGLTPADEQQFVAAMNAALLCAKQIRPLADRIAAGVRAADDFADGL